MYPSTQETIHQIWLSSRQSSGTEIRIIQWPKRIIQRISSQRIFSFIFEIGWRYYRLAKCVVRHKLSFDSNTIQRWTWLESLWFSKFDIHCLNISWLNINFKFEYQRKSVSKNPIFKCHQTDGRDFVQICSKVWSI